MRELARDDGFVARAAELTDAPAMLRVVQHAFRRWPAVPIDVSPLEHLEWKMTPPGGDVRYHTVVTLDGEVVASKLRWVARDRLRGHEYVTDSGADFAVAPTYQGRGLGRLTVDFETKGDRSRGEIAFDLVSTNVIIRDAIGREGKIARPLCAWSRPLRARSFVSANLRSGGPFRLARAAITALARRVAGRREVGALEVVLFDRFDQRADALWSEAQLQFDFARVRDAEFLNWRYADPRAGRANILGAVEAGELLGYAVVRPAERSLNLADLLVHPGHPDAGIALLRSASELGRVEGATSIIAWLPPAHPYEELLSAAGFVPSRTALANEYFQPRGHDQAAPLLEAFADPSLREHVTMGDFDFA